jgi:uncharacterized repeat protein (TIGR03803 family)
MREKNPTKIFVHLFSTAACALLLCGSMAAAQTSTVLHQFRATTQFDGSGSQAGLIEGPHGELYGDTYSGGSTDNGIVFELIPPSSSGGSWRYNILYSFLGKPDGSLPRGTLTRDHNGNLYGTTEIGGTFGCGTVFELSPVSGGAWTESVLYSFNCTGDAENPLSGVIFDNLGNLYGTTQAGGTTGFGTVFKLTPPSTSGGAWTETVLHNFHGNQDGRYPYYGLTFAGKGTFYGFTSYGGTYDRGTFYQMMAGGKETVLYSFSDGADGGGPSGEPILDASGNVFGVTGAGGIQNNGLVFQFTPPAISGQPWTETVLYSFTGTDGSQPTGVTFGPSGVLYGTSWAGGANNDGIVFQLTPPTSGGSWTESDLLDLDGKGDGDAIYSAPTLFGGTLYCVAAGGGTAGAGTVLAVTP